MSNNNENSFTVDIDINSEIRIKKLICFSGIFLPKLYKRAVFCYLSRNADKKQCE